MRIVPSLIALALCAVSVGTASGQQKAAPAPGKALTGIGLSYDAPRGQFTATGIQIKPSVKSNVSTPTTGTVEVTINVKLVTKFWRDNELPCAVFVAGGLIDEVTGTVDGGLETVTGEARMTGVGTATCTVSIPYAWNIPPADPTSETGLIVAFAVASVDHRGTTKRSTLQASGVENLPTNGATTKFTFDATL
jgi:hypothetical protein